jgi:general secretion pathway protein A
MYLNYYGFSDKPFALTPDPKFLYLTKGHKDALAAVWQGVEERKGLMVLTGEVGTGKTMLIHSILGKLPENVKTAFIFHSTFKFRGLLEQIFSELGESVSIREVEELKRRFIILLRKLKEQGGVLAVFIDEAQHLSGDVISEFLSLFRLESWIIDCLQLVLVGQPELDTTIDSAILKNRPKKMVFRIHIYPLSLQESLEYIEHRLRIVGRSSDEIFSSSALSLIKKFARGIPRIINIICDNALLMGYCQDLTKIEIQTIQEVIGNLEGPDYKQKNRPEPEEGATRPRFFYRRFFRHGLAVLFVFSLGAGLFFMRTEIAKGLFAIKGAGDNKTILTQVPPPVELNNHKKEKQNNFNGLNTIPEAHQKTDRIESLKQEAPLAFRPATRTIQIKKGETLSSLCIKYYGEFNESLIDLLITANPSIKNADLVLVNQKIQLPEKREESILTLARDNRFTVHLGTFSDPAQANRFKTEPTLKGSTVTIQPKKVVSRRNWYRVEAGKYEKKEEALEVIKALKKKGLLHFFK